MSIALLRTSLNQLTAQTYSSHSRGRLLRDVFSLIDGLSNPKNLEVLLRAFLNSPFWDNGDSIDTAYAVTDAARYLSSARATAQASICKATIDSAEVVSWRKTILSAALLAAETRNLEGTQALLWSTGVLAPTFVRNLNNAAAGSMSDQNAKAGLLIATSWILPALTSYQRTRIKSETSLALFDGLYLSQLAFTDKGKVEPQPRGLRELGLMTRVLVELYSHEKESSVLVESVKVLSGMSARFADDLNESDRFAKSVFLSSIAILQAILTSALHISLSEKQRTFLATSSLDVLKRLQNINPDNSVFESWRFVFTTSLQMLDTSQDGLSSYLDAALKYSPFSANPLSSTESKEIFSKRKDDEQVKWLLTIIEATASTVKNKKTLQRIFSFCFTRLKDDNQLTLEETELLHSVLISLITSHEAQFQAAIRPYTQIVLDRMEAVTDRQFIILFKALYRASLATKQSTTSLDPQGVLFTLKNKTVASTDVRKKKLCGTTIIELLPHVPKQYLRSNLEWVDDNIASTVSLVELEPRFIEICQTEMDSARALICVKYLLERSQRNVLAHAKL